MENIEPIQIYTDGACRGNPGCGGWGCIINVNGDEKEKGVIKLKRLIIEWSLLR